MYKMYIYIYSFEKHIVSQAKPLSYYIVVSTCLQCYLMISGFISEIGVICTNLAIERGPRLRKGKLI